MLQTLNEVLNGKYLLNKASSYDRSGGKTIILISDNKEELIDYCAKHNYDYKCSWPYYTIEYCDGKIWHDILNDEN